MDVWLVEVEGISHGRTWLPGRVHRQLPIAAGELEATSRRVGVGHFLTCNPKGSGNLGGSFFAALGHACF